MDETTKLVKKAMVELAQKQEEQILYQLNGLIKKGVIVVRETVATLQTDHASGELVMGKSIKLEYSGEETLRFFQNKCSELESENAFLLMKLGHISELVDLSD